MFIKNQTPYKGKLRLKFEKNPHYSSGGNKIKEYYHINCGN